MGYTTPRTWVAGEWPTAAQLNANVRDNVSFLANPPACRVYNNGAISHATTGAWQFLTFDSERYDPTSMHSTASLTNRITINTAGLYLLTGHIEFAANATGIRGAQFHRNADADGIANMYFPNCGAGTGTAVTISTVWKFSAGDFVELRAFQNSGGALNIQLGPSFSPEFSATWIGLG